MAPYTVHELETRAELDAVVDVIFKAQYSPYLPSVQIFFPVFGYTNEAYNVGVAAAQERLWKAHTSNPSSRWIIVLDNSNGEVVAGTQWEWNEKGTPFKNGIAKIDCDWWPDVEARKFCEEMLKQAFTPRCIWMQRPHASLSMMVVHPAHRRHGVGSLMMEWGNAKIDEMGMESFIEASELGRGLYERNGYMTVMKLSFYIPPGKGDDWNRYKHDLMMQDWYAMWRPAGGVVKEGQRNRPWQLVPPLEP